MPAKYPRGSVKHISSQISIDTHKKLFAIARDREITFDLLFRRLCEWAAQKSPIELLNYGVNLPVYIQDDLTPAQDIELPQ